MQPANPQPASNVSKSLWPKLVVWWHVGAGPKLVQTGIDQVINALKPREQQMLIALIVALPKQNVISQPDFLQGLHSFTDQLEDLRSALVPSTHHPPPSPGRNPWGSLHSD